MSGAADSGLVIRGGARGTAVAVDELRAAAVALERAGGDLALVGRRVPWRLADPSLAAAAALSPVAGGEVATAAARCLGPRGPMLVAADLAGTAVRARVTATRYAAAEEAVRSQVVAAGWWAARSGAWLPAAVLLGVIAVAATREGPPGTAARNLLGSRRGAQGVGLAVEGLPAVLLGLAGAPPVAGSVPGVARGVLAVARPGGSLHEGRVQLIGPSRTVPPPSRAARGVAGLLAGTERIAATGVTGGADPGTVRVTRVQRPGGRTAGGPRTAWVVHIPGTQSWTSAAPAGGTPFDLSGNVALMAGTPTAGREAVTAALGAAGARPDEPVLLVGHSQGGLVAASVAADAGVRGRFRITHVVTAGSPVAAVAVPEDVRVLSLEHHDDLVPRLDGRPNPDRRTWVTVVSGSPSQAGGSLPPHDSSGYVATAAAVDRSDDPDLRDLRRSMSPFLDGPGVTVDTIDVRAVRGEG